jgi:hypothetical protein
MTSGITRLQNFSLDKPGKDKVPSIGTKVSNNGTSSKYSTHSQHITMNLPKQYFLRLMVTVKLLCLTTIPVIRSINASNRDSILSGKSLSSPPGAKTF